jgi:hypothetical protein
MWTSSAVTTSARDCEGGNEPPAEDLKTHTNWEDTLQQEVPSGGLRTPEASYPNHFFCTERHAMPTVSGCAHTLTLLTGAPQSGVEALLSLVRCSRLVGPRSNISIIC